MRKVKKNKNVEFFCFIKHKKTIDFLSFPQGAYIYKKLMF